jgi:hypothetical protein
LRLIAAQSDLTLIRSHGFVTLDPGIWVAPVGGDLRLRLRRSSYNRPIREPCVAVALAFLALGETLTVARLCGAAVVAAGVVTINAPHRHAAVSATEPVADVPSTG